MKKPIIVIVRGQLQKDALKRKIDQLPTAPPYEVEIREYAKKRSLAQNRLIYLHFSQIAEQMFETPTETRARLKLLYGVPILLAENKTFAERWLGVTENLSHEQKLQAIQLIPITSIMTVKQLSKFIEAYMTDHELSGIVLAHPEDLFYEAMGLSRKKPQK